MKTYSDYIFELEIILARLKGYNDVDKSNIINNIIISFEETINSLKKNIIK